MTELRRVTALFADIVDSTRVGELLDPHEVQELVGQINKEFTAIVERLGGRVGAYLGDGIAGFFGVEQAHDDDASRAADAALEIVTLVRAMEPEASRLWAIDSLQVRVGVNTGKVAIQHVGADSTHPLALGDVVNVAARLEGSAPENAILVGSETARELRHLGYQLIGRGSISVKNRSAPVECWELVGGRDCLHSGSSTPLVGRAEELTYLDSILGEVRQGRGHVITVVGDAGIGKSRLLEEALVLAGVPLSVVIGCNEGRRLYPFDVFRAILRALCGLSVPSSKIESTRCWERMIAPYDLESDSTELLLRVLLGEWELLGYDESHVHTRRGDVFNAFALLIRAISETHGWFVIGVEGCERADREAQGILRWLLALTDEYPVCLVLSMRPERVSLGWALRTQALSDYFHRAHDLTLGELNEAESWQLIDDLDPKGQIRPLARTRIIKRASGNPLFLQEIVNLAQLSGQGVTPVTVDSAAGRLESCVLARFDHLPDRVGETLKAASLLGQHVDPRLVMKIVARKSVQDDLAELVADGWLLEQLSGSGRIYTFRHNVIREVIEATLPPDVRRELHEKVGRVLQESKPEDLDRRLEELAYHFSQGRDLALGARYSEMAALSALELGSPLSACEWLEQARSLYEAVGNTSGWHRSTDHLLSVLRKTGMGRDFALVTNELLNSVSDRRFDMMQEMAFALAEADEIAMLRDVIEEARMEHGACGCSLFLVLGAYADFRAGEFAEAMNALDSVSLSGDAEPRLSFLMTWLRAGWALQQGDIAEADMWTQRAAMLVVDDQSRHWGWKIQVDRAVIDLLRGRLDIAETRLAQVLVEATQVVHVPTIEHATNNLVYVQFLRGRLRDGSRSARVGMRWAGSAYWRGSLMLNLAFCEATRGNGIRAAECLDSADALISQSGDKATSLAVRLARGWALLLEGQSERAIEALSPLVELSHTTPGAHEVTLLASAWLAQLHMDRDEFDLAHRHAERAAGLASVHPTPLVPLGWRALGSSLAHQGKPEGQRLLQMALGEAKSSGMRLEEGRALLELARAGAPDGQDLMVRARAIFEECGARPDLESVDRALQGSRTP